MKGFALMVDTERFCEEFPKIISGVTRMQHIRWFGYILRCFAGMDFGSPELIEIKKAARVVQLLKSV
jgi:hypothetical protein